MDNTQDEAIRYKATLRLMDVALETMDVGTPVAIVYITPKGIKLATTTQDEKLSRELINHLKQYFNGDIVPDLVKQTPCKVCEGNGFYTIDKQRVQCRACNGSGNIETKIEDGTDKETT